MFANIFLKIKTGCTFLWEELHSALRCIQDFMKPIFTWIIEYLGDLADTTAENLVGSDYRAQAKFVSTSKNNVLSANNKGVCIATKRLPLSLAYESMIAIAAPGSGKTQSIILYCLMYMTGISKIFNDTKKELLEYRGIFQAKNIPVFVLDLFNPRDGNVRYNPVFVAMQSGHSGLRKLARKLVYSSPEIKKDFFNNSAESLVFTMLVIHTLVFKEETTLSFIYQSLERLSNKQDSSISELLEEANNSACGRAIEALNGTSDATRSSIISTAMSFLSWTQDPAMQYLCGAHTIDWQWFREQEGVLYICQNQVDSAYNQTYINIIYEEFYRFILDAPPAEHEVDIAFLLDEFGSSVYIENFDKIIALTRSYRIINVMICQTLSQLEDKYPQTWKGILGNCATQLYFSGLVDEGEYLESMLGTMEYEDESGNAKTRPLLLRDELRTMPQGDAILVVRNHHPIKLQNLLPFWKNSKAQKQVQRHPPQSLISYPELKESPPQSSDETA